MRHLALLILIFSISCQGRPLRSPSAQGKATRDLAPPPNQIELFPVWIRGPTSLESRILLQPEVLGCLRQSPEVERLDFLLQIAGTLDSKGRLQGLSVQAPTPSLEVCLKLALAHFHVSSNERGAFALKLTRQPLPGAHSKSFFLDLGDVKKFQ